MKGILFTEDNHRSVREGLKVQTRRPMRLNRVKGGKEWVIEYPNGEAQRTTPSGVVTYAPDGLHCIDSQGRLRGFSHERVIKACPYGHVGSMLYVKEPCTITYWDDYENAVVNYQDGASRKINVPVEDTYTEKYPPGRPRKIQGLFMPEYAARTRIKVTGMSYGYVRDIDAVDAIKEGIHCNPAIQSLSKPEAWAIERYQHQSSNCWKDYSKDHAYNLTPEQSHRTLWESIHGADGTAAAWDLAVVWIVDFSLDKTYG